VAVTTEPGPHPSSLARASGRGVARDGEQWRAGLRPGRASRPGEWVAPLCLGGIPALVTWVAFGILAADGWVLTGREATAVEQGLSFGAIVLCLLGASACLLLWQVAGEPAEWLPVGAGLLACGLIEAPSLLTASLRSALPMTGAGWGPLHLAAVVTLLAGMCLLAWPALRVLGSRLLGRDAPMLVVPAALLLVGALVFVGLEGTLASRATGPLLEGVPAASAASAIALAYGVAWWRRRGPLHLFLCVSLLVVAQAGLAEVLRGSGTPGMTLVPGVLLLEAALCAAVGAVVTLRRRVADHNAALHHSELRRRELEQQEHSERARAAEARHEFRSALLSVRGGVHLLEARVEELGSDPAREALECVRWGIESLSCLATAEPARDRAFRPSEVLRREAAAASHQGQDVRLELAPGLGRALGDPLAVGRAVRALLDNARLHAPTSSVTLRARQQDGRISIKVADQGPGIPLTERERVFRRGERGATAAAGEGLGLGIARRLLREQGGDLWAEPRPGGGACFVLRLRAASPAGAPAADPPLTSAGPRRERGGEAR